MERYRIEDIQKAILCGRNVKLFKAFEYDEKSNAYVFVGQFDAPAKTANKKLQNFIKVDWAAKIHHDEGDEKKSAIIIRNVPESVRRDLKAKAALEGKSMQGLCLELITKYISQ